MNTNSNKNFWKTLPGILTGLASLVTAIAGVWLLIDSRSTGSHQENPASIPTADINIRYVEATKTYWDSLLVLDNEYYSKAFHHRNEAVNHLHNQSADQFMEQLKIAAQFMSTHIIAIEKLHIINVDPELLALTAKGLVLERDWASKMFYWASLWERPDIVRELNLLQEIKESQDKTMVEISALEEKLNENSNSIRTLRIKMVDKYKVEFPLQ